jgi:hypothetical protein
MALADTRAPLLVQGGYYVGTGVVPFVSRRAFEAVTGPKREWWLVQTVGALVTVQGAGLLAAAVRRRQTPELVATGAGVALALGAIDVVYVARRRIAPTYLADAAAQGALVWSLARRWRARGTPSAPPAAVPSHARP